MSRDKELHIPIQIDESSIEELLEIIKKESDGLINEARKCKYVDADDEIHRLLDEENLKRYEAVNTALKFPLQNFDYDFHQIIGTIDEVEELGRLMQCWITLGSAVETSIQIFLSIYLNDYQNSNWGKWEDFNHEEVKTSIVELIVQLRDSGHIEMNNSKSLKNDIKDYLKKKKDITSLENVNLQNLIAFFEVVVEWEKCNIDALNKIRMNRNAIHSFKQRQVDGWDDLVHSLKFYCILLLDLQSMMPPFDDVISDMLQYEREAYDNYY